MSRYNDNEEEAIEYTKTDNCTKEWIETWSELGEIPWDSSSLSKEVMVAKTLEGNINIEPILERIIESDFQSSSEIVKIQTTGKIYKIPPDVGETVLVKLYTPNKPTDILNKKLGISGAGLKRYYQTEGFIKRTKSSLALGFS